MEHFRLERKHPADILSDLERGFSALPLVSRECVKALNTLLYNMQHGSFDAQFFKEAVVHVLRGLTSRDQYVRRYVCVALIELCSKSKNGMIAINSLVKELNDKKSPAPAQDAALRALFSVLPQSFYFDFESYVSTAALQHRSSALVVAQQFFCRQAGVSPSDLSYASSQPSVLNNNITDYHRSYFVRLRVNRYSGLLEIRRLAAEQPERLAPLLSPVTSSSADPVVVLEACKALAWMEPERAAALVPKAVTALRSLLSASAMARFATSDCNTAFCSCFAALSVLSKMSVSFPMQVAKANSDIEAFVGSSSATISMLSILVLLRTGTGDSVRRLAVRLEPFLRKMTGAHKRMAVEALEQIALRSLSSSSAEFSSCDAKEALGGAVAFSGASPKAAYSAFDSSSAFSFSSPSPLDDYVRFICKALSEHGPLDFKQFVIGCFERLLRLDVRKHQLLSFLAAYIEDSEYYQLSMSILGLLGEFLDDQRLLPHIYNRLLLDNSHVRKCALQSLYCVAARGVSAAADTGREVLAAFRDSETGPLVDFLLSADGDNDEKHSSEKCNDAAFCAPFSVAELGPMERPVMQYVASGTSSAAARGISGYGSISSANYGASSMFSSSAGGGTGIAGAGDRALAGAEKRGRGVRECRSVSLTAQQDSNGSACAEDASVRMTKVVKDGSVALRFELVLKSMGASVEVVGAQISLLASRSSESACSTEGQGAADSPSSSKKETEASSLPVTKTVAVSFDREELEGGRAVKQTQETFAEGYVFSGVLEYVVAVDDETERETVRLEPFAITPFDTMVPAAVPDSPSLPTQAEKEVVLGCSPSEAISHIADTLNLMFVSDGPHSARFSGFYYDKPVIVVVKLTEADKATIVRIVIRCSDPELGSRLAAVFE